MKLLLLSCAILSPVGLTSCINVNPPTEPIHIIVDVNVRVQIERELDKYFDFGDEAAADTETQS